MKLTKAEAAIEETCKRCVDDPFPQVRWQDAIARCDRWECPLYSVRPRTTLSTEAALGRMQNGRRG